MKNYVVLVKQLDPNVEKAIMKEFEGQQGQNEYMQEKAPETKQQQNLPSGTMKRKVEVIDYSESYSHPYFKAIQKMEEIPPQKITHDLLMTKNSAPAVYPLHFAIDKERPQLV